MLQDLPTGEASFSCQNLTGESIYQIGNMYGDCFTLVHDDIQWYICDTNNNPYNIRGTCYLISVLENIPASLMCSRIITITGYIWKLANKNAMVYSTVD